MSSPLPPPAATELQMIADLLARCVERLDAAGLGIAAAHVDHGRALIARRLLKSIAANDLLSLAETSGDAR